MTQEVTWKFTRAHLMQRQSLPLDAKVRMAEMRIRQWYDSHEGNVHVSFSGGKDSTVALHLVRSIYPRVPAVFVNTGLEFPEIVDFVAKHENVTVLRPEKSFYQVIKEFGYPVISKQVSYYLRQIRDCKGEVTRTLRLTGIRSDGKKSNRSKLPDKYRYLIDSPFKISDQCCDYLKKKPFIKYQKETGSFPYTGMMADESSLRAKLFMQHGCNVHDGRTQASHPMMVWKEQDVWDYAALHGIRFAEVYYDHGDIKAETRTGCVFCLFGCSRDPNRFDRLKQRHPDMHDYCMNKLKMKDVLKYIESAGRGDRNIFDSEDL